MNVPSAMAICDPRGLPLATASPEAACAFDRAVADYLHYRGDPARDAARAAAADPGFALAHVMRAYMALLSTEGRKLPAAREAVAAAKTAADRASPRERAHVTAAEAWAAGDLDGCALVLERMLTEHPRDLLALAIAHYVRFFLGEAEQQRDIPARALPAWDEGVPGHGLLLGLYAFGLNECGQYREAEAAGRGAVALDGDDVYAIHAVAHVLEAETRVEEGLAWLDRHEAVWARHNFACHLGWHRTLLELEADDHARALATWDAILRRADSDAAVDLNDATALLWRLDLLGLDTGGRWAALAELWLDVADGSTYVFNDMHAMMAYAATGRRDAAEALLRRIEASAGGGTTNARTIREVGLAVCRGIDAFGREDWRAAAEHILPVRYRTRALGSSRLQQGVVAATLIEAALRAGDGDLAWTLAAERTALDEGRPSAWLLRARAARLRGDRRAAQDAETMAQEARQRPPFRPER